jgi:hypothetical protein
MEMGLWRCLPRLQEAMKAQTKGQEEVQAEQALVIGARVWLAVFNTEYQ